MSASESLAALTIETKPRSWVRIEPALGSGDRACRWHGAKPRAGHASHTRTWRSVACSVWCLASSSHGALPALEPA